VRALRSILRILFFGVQPGELAAARLGAKSCFVCGKALGESAYVVVAAEGEWLRFCLVTCERDWRWVVS